IPCFFWALVPPPSGTLPPLTIAWPPRRGWASTRMTDAPASRATMAAGMPVAPDPITTTSASECHATIDILRVVTAVEEPRVESVARERRLERNVTSADARLYRTRH